MDKKKNEFSYHNETRGSFPYYRYIKWEVHVDGTYLTGEAETVRQAVRRAKRAVRRHRKMDRFLNK